MRNRRSSIRIATALAVAALTFALDSPVAAQQGSDFGSTASSAERDLQRSLKELSELRESIAAEKLPLTRQLSRLENALIEKRAEYDGLTRQLDNTNLELATLEQEISGGEDQRGYVSNLLDEYLRNLETRVHITELQRYQAQLEHARLAPDNADLTASEVYTIQTAAVDASLDRALELLGGTTFAGRAVGEDGVLRDVEFALVGPFALYATSDGDAGLAEQRLGSLEPNMIGFEEPTQTASAREVVSSRHGLIPLDPTLGNAQRIEQTQDSIVQHIEKGGPVMIPILVLAAAALLVALLKWVQLSRVRKPSQRKIDALFDKVKAGDFTAAAQQVSAIRGPTGEMLKSGVEHLREPKQLVEEVMFEKTLETRLSLQRYLSFVAVTAAAAPLMGLLGTVTGIINTFKLITVFGTGDPKTLSSGISEALITTEFGLIVAIPALFLHAFLSRKTKRVVDAMEKTAVSFLNRIPSRRGDAAGGSARTTDDEAERRTAPAGDWVAGRPIEVDH